MQPEFIDKFIDHDIFCVQETHCDLEEALNIPNFSRPVHLIRKRLKNTGKRSGGLSIFVRDEIRPGVKFLEHQTSDYIWLHLDRNFFGLRENIYLCFVYNPQRIHPLV